MKKAATIFAVGLTIGMIMILFLCNTPTKNDQPSADERKVEEISKKPPTTYTDKGGTTHTEKPTAVADLASLKYVYEKQIDSLLELLDTKQRELDYITGLSTETKGTFKPDVDTVYLNDSSAQYSVNYSDQWLSISGVVNEDSTWKYQYNDSLALVSYYKKQKGFLNFKKDLYLDGFSYNPASTIKGLTSYKVKAPAAKQNFELNAEARNRWIQKQVQPSAAANARIFITKKWSVEGSYGKVLIGDKWITYQEAAIKFNIIKF
jgi:hypothetical protein